MIRLLRLEGWKGFSSLELPLEDGATFVVARNGIGKTSFVQAAAWVLFGARTKIHPALALRRGHTTGMVEITLGDKDGPQQTIRRTISVKKKGTGVDVATFINDAVADDAAVDAVLRDRFGANPDDLARLAVLPAGALGDYDTEKLHLRRYLCSLYGIDRIEDALASFDDERRATAAALKKVRSAGKVDAAQVTAARSALDELTAALAATSDELATAQQTHQELLDQVTAAERFEAAQVARRAQTAAAEAVAAQVAELVGAPVAAQAVAASVRDHIDAANATIDDTNQELARHEARRELAHELLSQLTDSDGDCPVCRRPLDAEHREQAVAGHLADIAAADDAIRVLEDRNAAQKARRRTLQDVQGQLRDPLELPADPGATAVHARTVAVAAGERVTQLATEVGELRQQVAHHKGIIDAAAQAQDAHREAVALYRRELLVGAAVDSAQEVLTTLLTQRIDPLSDEVADRWKKVFAGSRGGIQVTADGEIVLNRGGGPLSFHEMSAGERSVALLTTRLLALAALNRRSFAILDEPLEQLDPANRRIVALLLARAPSPAVPQIIATTFEEQLARRLERQLGDVHLEFIAADS